MRILAVILSVAMLLAALSGCDKREKKTWDGPFGLQEGVSLKDFTQDYKVTDPKPGKLVYEAYDVPRADDRFTHYQLWFDQDVGLCKIVAQGKMLNVNEDGHQLKHRYAEVAKMLIQQYGPMTDDFDFVKADSALSASNQWMMSLFKKERVLGGYWEDGKGKRGGGQAILTLPDHLKMITVNARAYSPTTGAVDVEYEFSNFNQCELVARFSFTE